MFFVFWLFFFRLSRKPPVLPSEHTKPLALGRVRSLARTTPLPCLPESCYTDSLVYKLTPSFTLFLALKALSLSPPHPTSFMCTHISLLSRQNRQHVLSTLTWICTFAKNTPRFKSIYLPSMPSYKRRCGTHYAPNRPAWLWRIQSVITY